MACQACFWRTGLIKTTKILQPSHRKWLISGEKWLGIGSLTGIASQASRSRPGELPGDVQIQLTWGIIVSTALPQSWAVSAPDRKKCVRSFPFLCSAGLGNRLLSDQKYSYFKTNKQNMVGFLNESVEWTGEKIEKYRTEEKCHTEPLGNVGLMNFKVYFGSDKAVAGLNWTISSQGCIRKLINEEIKNKFLFEIHLSPLSQRKRANQWRKQRRGKKGTACSSEQLWLKYKPLYGGREICRRQILFFTSRRNVPLYLFLFCTNIHIALQSGVAAS